MIKINKRKWKVFFVLSIFASSLTFISAASHKMEWNGSGIISKASNESFYGHGEKITIYNNVTGVYNPRVLHAKLTLRKYEFWGKSNAKVMNQYNMGGQSWTYTTGNGSHYDMYFQDGYGSGGGAYPNPIDMQGYID